MLLNGCLKDSLVDGFVDAFFILYILPEILILVDALIALAESDDYLRISARSCKESMGAGGIRQTTKAPVNLRILGGFVIDVDGVVDGLSII